MAIDPRSLLKSDSANLSGDALMQARPEVLRGVDAAQQAALETLEIRSVFDLAASAAFAAARRLLRLQDDATLPEAQLQRVASDISDTPAGIPVAELALLPIQALKGVGAQRAPALRAALAAVTVRDLALWPPYGAARALLADQLASSDPPPPGDPGTPPELLPKNGAFPTERVLYRKLLIDSLSATGVQPLEQAADALSLTDVLSGKAQGFARVASGALLTFSQDWFAQGVALGQLLHSLSLAPGESTRMAMIDWSRQSRGSGSEDIDEVERLANTTTHQRALSEVTEATAVEVQGGSTRTKSKSSASQGGSALGFEVGPIAFGGSSGSGSTTTEALTVTSSFGRRNLAASVAQQINDVSQQQASAARSRRASIVQEVAQSEHEALSTRVVCNYNHMHALNVQYYEVVQAFRVTTTLQRAERVVFVPLKLVDFGEALVLERWRGVLADAALTDDIRRQLTTEFGVVEIAPNVPRLRIGEAVLSSALRGAELAGKLSAAVAAAPVLRARAAVGAVGGAAEAASPAGFSRIASSRIQGVRLEDVVNLRADTAAAATPEAAAAAAAATEAVRDLRFDLGPPQSGATLTALKGFDARQLGRLASLSGRTLLRNASDAVFVPDEARLHGVAVLNARASGLSVRTRSGAELPAGAAGPAQLTLAAPARFAELRGVQVLLRPDDQPGPARLRLLIDIGGVALPLDAPVVLPAPGQAVEIVRFEAVRAAPALLKHLRDNALHYSRAVFERLDATTLSALLSRFTLRGVPLGALVDPQPVALVANALVMKLNLPARGAVENPALAAEAEAWQSFLLRRGLDRPVPQSQTVPLPSGGVFAEAVLGRFNSAEKIDLTRFFDWQASPIPLTPPDIAALPSGSRKRAVDLSTSALGAPLLKQTEATALPAGVNSAAILAALQAGSPFRDLSAVIAANAGLAQSGSELSGAGATAAATQAANTLQTVMAQNTERLKIAADLFTATQGAGQGAADKAKASPTQAGLAMTTADRQDKAAQGAAPSLQTGATPEQIAAGAAGGATLEQQAQAAQTGSSGATATQQAIEQAVAGVADETPAKAAPAPAQRRGGRRVQGSGTAPPPADAGGLGVVGAVVAALTDVPFSVRYGNGLFGGLLGRLSPLGPRRLRIVDAGGRTVFSVQSDLDVIEGTRPASATPVTYEFSVESADPAFTLRGKRRAVPPQGIGQRERLGFFPIHATREVRVSPSSVPLVFLASEAELLALPEVQALGGELARRTTSPKVTVRGTEVFIVFSVFELSLAHQQILG